MRKTMDGGRLVLALRRSEGMPLRSHHSAAGEYSPVGRLLVIAEDFEVVDAVTEFFADLGYEAHGALDGPDALAITRAAAPEVILLDVQMPGLSELFTQLRATFDVPIMVAAANAATAQQLRPLGAFAYIHKPFDWEALRRRVAILLCASLPSGKRD